MHGRRNKVIGVDLVQRAGYRHAVLGGRKVPRQVVRQDAGVLVVSAPVFTNRSINQEQ